MHLLGEWLEEFFPFPSLLLVLRRAGLILVDYYSSDNWLELIQVIYDAND